jgi:hypothetical protein
VGRTRSISRELSIDLELFATFYLVIACCEELYVSRPSEGYLSSQSTFDSRHVTLDRGAATSTLPQHRHRPTCPRHTHHAPDLGFAAVAILKTTKIDVAMSSQPLNPEGRDDRVGYIKRHIAQQEAVIAQHERDSSLPSSLIQERKRILALWERTMQESLEIIATSTVDVLQDVDDQVQEIMDMMDKLRKLSEENALPPATQQAFEAPMKALLLRIQKCLEDTAGHLADKMGTSYEEARKRVAHEDDDT